MGCLQKMSTVKCNFTEIDSHGKSGPTKPDSAENVANRKISFPRVLHNVADLLHKSRSGR